MHLETFTSENIFVTPALSYETQIRLPPTVEETGVSDITYLNTVSQCHSLLIFIYGQGRTCIVSHQPLVEEGLQNFPLLYFVQEMKSGMAAAERGSLFQIWSYYVALR